MIAFSFQNVPFTSDVPTMMSIFVKRTMSALNLKNRVVMQTLKNTVTYYRAVYPCMLAANQHATLQHLISVIQDEHVMQEQNG